MPAWLASLLIPFGISILNKVALPFLDGKFPKEAQLIDAAIQFLEEYFEVGTPPTAQLTSAAEHYHSLDKLIK